MYIVIEGFVDLLLEFPEFKNSHILVLDWIEVLVKCENCGFVGRSGLWENVEDIVGFIANVIEE